MRAGSSRQGVIILRWRGDYLVGNGNYLPIDPRQDRRQNRSEGLEGALLVARGSKEFNAHFKTYLCIPGITTFLTKAATKPPPAFDLARQSGGGMHRYGSCVGTPTPSFAFLQRLLPSIYQEDGILDWKALD